MTFVVSGFYMFQVSYLLSYETIFFLRNFCIEEPFNLDYIIHFYKPKKGLSCAIFTLKILVEKYLVGQMIKVLPGNLPRVIFRDCATIPSVNNETNRLR